MGQLSDKVKIELQKEFFNNHKALFLINPREYCRECSNYVEKNARERLINYKRQRGDKDPEILSSSDFL